jgi:hypothetical protein
MSAFEVYTRLSEQIARTPDAGERWLLKRQRERALIAIRGERDAERRGAYRTDRGRDDLIAFTPPVDPSAEPPMPEAERRALLSKCSLGRAALNSSRALLQSVWVTLGPWRPSNPLFQG